MSLVAAAGLAAFGGAYPAATIPLLAACAAVFLLTRAHVAVQAETRLLDLALVAALAAILVQAIPLPGPIVSTLSPEAWPLRSMLQIDRIEASWPLSIDARLTRQALAMAAAAVLLFWAAREALSRGGIRVAARATAWTGLALTLLAVAQRATAPGLILWHFAPADPGSQPFGLFVNGNHFATWLLMAGALTAGYLAAHRRTHRTAHSSRRLLVRDWLADGSGLILAGAIVAMLLGLAASASRAAILGGAAGLAFALWLMEGRGAAGRPARAGAIAIAFVMAAAVWGNRETIERKFEAGPAVARTVIWRETMPLVRDFWFAGTGAGTYSRAMLRYQRTSPEVHFNQAHSEYVQLVAEGGLLLTLPALVAIFVWLRLARRQLRRDVHETWWLRVGAAAGLLAAAVQGIFETGWRVPANALLCALLAAIVVHERQH